MWASARSAAEVDRGSTQSLDTEEQVTNPMFKTMKRSTVVIVSLITILTLSVVAYAVTSLFFASPTQTSEYEKRTYFEFVMENVFTASGEVGPGESMSVNPTLSSNASVDMYCFIRVEMPAYGESGLYTLTPNSGWNVQESGMQGDRWVAVYRYDSVLMPGASTTALTSNLTMVDMSRAEYSEVTDLNVSMTGYACGTEDLELENAWETISQNYGV